MDRVVSFAENQVLLAQYGTAATIETSPVSMNGANYGAVTFDVTTLFTMGTPPGASLDYQAEGSNDGQNWTPIAALADSSSTVELTSSTGEAAFGLIRFLITLTLTAGAAGDWGCAIFSLHARLLSS